MSAGLWKAQFLEKEALKTSTLGVFYMATSLRVGRPFVKLPLASRADHNSSGAITGAKNHVLRALSAPRRR